MKLDTWKYKVEIASKFTRRSGDFRFWTIVFEETDKCIAGGGDENVSPYFKSILSAAIEML